MTKKNLIYIVLFTVMGLIIGYLLFGKIGNEYVSLKAIFHFSKSGIESFGRSISGLTKIKQNIFISGGAGAVLGFVISLIRKK
jgi:hypothetical protein